jgi:malonyl-CoA O-methyltransferase
VSILDLLRRKPRAASTAELRAYFNEAASSEEHYPSTIDPRIFHVKLVMEHLGDMSGKLVADVGCGKGRFGRVIQERYPTARVCAVDIAEAMLAHVPKGIYRAAAAMTALPLSSGSCDGAFATESLEHAVDIPMAVEELCRVVKPGGRIAIIDKDIKAWGRLETPWWERWFARGELEKLLAKHCAAVSSRPISYWEDVEPDGLFLAWLAVK